VRPPSLDPRDADILRAKQRMDVHQAKKRVDRWRQGFDVLREQRHFRYPDRRSQFESRRTSPALLEDRVVGRDRVCRGRLA
jgi:hypothetical protein